jgi:hypothetical protein
MEAQTKSSEWLETDISPGKTCYFHQSTWSLVCSNASFESRFLDLYCPPSHKCFILL